MGFSSNRKNRFTLAVGQAITNARIDIIRARLRFEFSAEAIFGFSGAARTAMALVGAAYLKNEGVGEHVRVEISKRRPARAGRK